MTDKRYGKETFSVNIADYMVQFGPPRGEGVPGYLDPATSVNTWTVRHAMVRAEAIIQMNGTIHLKYHVQDIWDVRPSDNKGTAYNTVTTPLGFVWHDVVGASEPLIKANWIIRYTPSNGQINYE